MRKLLLATVAALGASMGAATYADAQIADNTDGQANVGAPYAPPGTVTVRLNGRYRFYAGHHRQWRRQAGHVRHGDRGRPGCGLGGEHGRRVCRDEHDQRRHQQAGELRPCQLRPLVSGLRRRRSQRPEVWRLVGKSGQITARPAGGGVYGFDFRPEAPVAASCTSGVSRATSAADRFGQIRVGASDQPSSLYLTGNFENFDDGGLDGDLPDFLPGAVALAYPEPNQGNLYTTNKIMYLSPQFYGVDFGISWEPTTASR